MDMRDFMRTMSVPLRLQMLELQSSRATRRCPGVYKAVHVCAALDGTSRGEEARVPVARGPHVRATTEVASQLCYELDSSDLDGASPLFP